MRERTVVLGATVPETVHAFMSEQANFLSQNGWQVHIVTSPGPRPAKLQRGSVELNEVVLHEIPMERNPAPFKDLRSIAAWLRLLHQIKPQVVLVGTPKAALLGMLASKFLRVQNRVYLVRGLRLEGQTGIHAKIGALMERITCWAATDVVCVSNSLKSAMVRRRLVPVEKACVLGSGSSNGVAIDRFRPPSIEEYSAARLSFNIEANALVVGFAGRLTQDKGLDDLLKAIEIVSRTHPQACLLVAGEADSGSALPKRLHFESQKTSIIFTGRVEDMVDFYHSLDIFCLPSLREGMPNVNLEAAACGLPVITTTATGCIDSIVQDQTGFAVSQGDPESLANSVLRLASNSDARKAFGIAGRMRVEEEFRQEIVWENQLQFLDSLVPIDSSPQGSIIDSKSD